MPDPAVTRTREHPNIARAMLARDGHGSLVTAAPIANGLGCGPDRGWVSSHSARAATVGSIPTACHHAASSPWRCTSRWCPRHKGTVNSSLTLRPSARLCVKRRWWVSQGWRPQTRQGCLATCLTCSRSRTRRGSDKANALLSIVFDRALFFDFAGGELCAVEGCVIPCPLRLSVSSVAKLASFTWKLSSTRRASAAVSLFFSASDRCAQSAASSPPASSLISPRRRSRSAASFDLQCWFGGI